MFKNTGSQKLTVLAFADAGHATLDAGDRVTGDAANITLKIEQDDDGTQSASNDTNPTEVEDGQYVFDLTQAETNGDKLTFYPESSTAGVQVVALPSLVIYTRPPNFADLIYFADIECTIDDASGQDEYTVRWYKNGARVTTGITSPQIQVVKRADGTDLIAATSMTQIGSGGAYKYDEATNRLTAGEAAEAIVTATIDGATRTFSAMVGRDSESS